MAGIRNTHAVPPRQKEAVLPEDLIAMLETLDRGTLRGLRDRAMLLAEPTRGPRWAERRHMSVDWVQQTNSRNWG